MDSEYYGQRVLWTASTMDSEYYGQRVLWTANTYYGQLILLTFENVFRLYYPPFFPQQTPRTVRTAYGCSPSSRSSKNTPPTPRCSPLAGR